MDYKQNALENSRLRHTNKILKILIVLIILLSALAIGVLLSEDPELKKQNSYLNTKIEDIKSQNETIKRRRDMYERLLKGSQQENRRLVNKISNLEDKEFDNTTVYRTSTKTRQVTAQPNYSNAKTYKAPKRTYTKQKSIKQTKKYQNFSNNIKLVSDSKIMKKSDNRLISNATIYGEYHPRQYSIINSAKNQIANIKCGLKNNRYNVVDECSMDVSNSYDRLYLGAMDSKTIKEFNYKTHMIECEYSKEHGVMHSCKIKRYKFNEKSGKEI